MKTLALIESMLVDIGVASYKTHGWGAMHIFPNMFYSGCTIIIQMRQKYWCEITANGSMLDINIFGGPNRPVKFFVDLTDPDSIDRLKSIIVFKNNLKDTSSPA